MKTLLVLTICWHRLTELQFAIINILQKALDGVDGGLNYADDIILTSNEIQGEEHHLRMLDTLLANCDPLNIRLNSHKTKLFVNESVPETIVHQEPRRKLTSSKDPILG